MPPSEVHLYPLHVGTCRLGEDHVLGDDYSAEDRITFALYAFLVDGGPGRRLLIDLGPVGLDYLNTMFRRYGFFRDLPGDPDAIRQPQGNIFAWLARLQIDPADISHIVLTHFHADHHGTTEGRDGGALLRFPNAMIHASRIGWEDNLAKRRDGQWASYVDYGLSDFLLEADEQGRARFHDDDEIIPGVDFLYLGGHSICSQGVRVHTAGGNAIVTSDEVYQFRLLEQGILARLHTTPGKLAEATGKLVDLARAGAILLPCHEPDLARAFNRSGKRWLKQIRPLSDRAARGYLQSLKRSL
jgi:glyoxylase-like metal-dependent hydrolase (beta-lactamase superfamily II)